MKKLSVLFVAAPLVLGMSVSAHADDPAWYAGKFYDPDNAASPTGFTTGYELFRTIGCPGRQLLGKPCKVPPPPEAAAQKAPLPARVANTPEPAAVVKVSEPVQAPVAALPLAPAQVAVEHENKHVLTKDMPLTLKDVNFRFNRYNLMRAALPILDQAADDLKEANYPKVKIDGFTDDIGSVAYNLKLSGERAESVKKYLVERGVPAGTLETKGFGKTDFIASNKTAAGRFDNRRVELHVL